MSSDANASAQTEKSQEPVPSQAITQADYDSGVSNGDVDWLFRGKASKKLAKKKQDVGVSLNFTKQPTAPSAQSHQKPSESALTEALKTEKLKQAQLKKNEPLKPALVNHADSVKNRSRSSSDSGKSLSHKDRTESLSGSLPRQLQRSASSPHSSNPPPNGSTVAQQVPVPAKKNLLSSLSSKFAKPSSAATSPVSTSPVQQPIPNNSNVSHLNINQAKKAPPPVASTPPEQKGLFGLRRKLSVSKGSNTLPPTPAPPAVQKQPAHHVPTSQPKAPHHHKEKKVQRPDLDSTKLRRVVFALDKLRDDPQQQIPSRNPKKGDVLVPEDILAEPARLSIGIADGNNNVSQAKRRGSQNSELLALAYASQREAMIESQKHAHEAHLAAQRMAREVSSFKFNKNSKGREDVGEDEENFVHTPSNLQNIDNPLHHHINHFGDENRDSQATANEEDEKEAEGDLSLEAIYTRCCHLREILPIPATLKQLKNKSKPLTVLKMLNPKPTLIDILSFSDFIAITPIVTIIFDNVTIDTEMLKTVLSSISTSLYLEKLSLRNVAIDEEGWLYLCKFITLSKSLIKLDISQQKIKVDTPKNMHRSEMDWDLFNRSLVKRGGIEELVINGCKLTDLQFSKLIENGISLSTKRLGVAATNLNLAKCTALSQWIISDSSTCIGVDIAFNDMSEGQLAPFIDSFKPSTKLAFFSLNSTNVSVGNCEKMIKTLSYLKNLRFLDLSNIPQCFPGIIQTLAEWLPKFQDLRRVHFELDELTGPELVAIANILPNCKNLIHVSFLGHKDMNYATAVALYSAIKLSSIYTLDIDYDLIPEDLSSKIALYLMINMEKSMNKDLNFEYQRSDEELMADGSLITQAAEKMLEKNTNEGQTPSAKRSDQLYSKEIITKALIEKTSRVRKDIHKQMDKLFDLRMRGQLSLEGKETLIRFCLLDNSLEKVVNIFEEEELEAEKVHTVTEIAPTVPEDEHLHKVSSDILESGPIVSPNLPINAHQTSYFPALLPQQPITTEHPHMVVTDSNKEGEDIPIDQSTGRPVLFRKLSHTSEHAKKQEEEEGEFHKWGFFMQQQNSLFSNPIGKADTAPKPTGEPVAPQQRQAQLPQQQQQQPQSHPVQPKKLNILPSGPELREAIIKARGLEKINNLIDQFNIDHNRNIQLEDLFNTLAINKETQQHQNNAQNINQQIQSQQRDQHESEEYNEIDRVVESMNNDLKAQTSPLSIQESDHHGSNSPRSINSLELDEAYDKLLNEVDRVRSNKA